MTICESHSRIRGSLPADSEIDVVLFGTGVCSSSLAAKTIKGPRSSGHRFRVRFRPADQIVGSGVEWCQREGEGADHRVEERIVREEARRDNDSVPGEALTKAAGRSRKQCLTSTTFTLYSAHELER